MYKFQAVAAGAFLLLANFSSTSFAEEGNAEAGAKIFKSCSACHSVGEGAKNRAGPVLNGVIGRPAGSFEGYKYGTGLLAANEKGLVWDEEAIFNWLLDPKKFVRGYLGDKKAKAKMGFKLKDDQKRRDVIAYLETYSPKEEAEAEEAEATEGDAAATTMGTTQ